MGALILILFCLILYRTCRHRENLTRVRQTRPEPPVVSPQAELVRSTIAAGSHDPSASPHWRTSSTTRRGPRLNREWSCEMICEMICGTAAEMEPHQRNHPFIVPKGLNHRGSRKRINTMKINPSSKSRWKLIIIECNVRSPYVFLTLKPPTYYYCIAHFSFQYYTYDTHSIVPFSFSFTFLSMTK